VLGAAFFAAFRFSVSVFAVDTAAPGLLLSLPGSIGGTSGISPSFLFSADPRAAAYNPAAFPDRELPVFGAAAALAFPTGQGSGSGAYGLLSASLPTVVGNAYVLADAVFAQSSLTGFAAPLGTSILLGLAKSASDDLSFGASFGATSQSGDIVSNGLFGAIGTQFRFPRLAAGGTDFSFALLGLGVRTAPWNAFSPTMTWTPLVAASTRLVDGRSFSLTASLLFASPEFSDLFFSAGASFGLGNSVSLDLGWLFSLSETVRFASGEGSVLNAPRFFPAIALRLDGSSFLRVSSYGASLAASFRPVSGGAAIAETSVVLSRGSRDIDGPRIILGSAAGHDFSPLHSNVVVVPVSIRDESQIAAWEAVLYDDSGNAFFRQGENPKQKDKTDLFARFFSLKNGIKSPTEIQIPLKGTMKNGLYRLRLWARDMRGNEGRSEEFRLMIDGEVPQAQLSVESSTAIIAKGTFIFTPNGDGVNDSLSIRQSGSGETLWTGRFIDTAGKTVRTYRWTDGTPLSFVWDGNDETGARVSDGQYSYLLESTDAAGNDASFSLEKIIVDAEPTPLSLSMDVSSLSPDQDGSFDSVRLFVNASSKHAPLDWNIELVSDKGLLFRSWKGASARLDVLPSSLVFDGRTVEGDVIPDGVYRFRARLRYSNGNEPSAFSSALLIDTKKPDGRVRASTQVLSIDLGVSLTFYHDLSRNASWRGVVSDENGIVMRVLPIVKAGESSIDWNGLRDDGTPIPDGKYRYAAEGKSATGILGKTASVPFLVESKGSVVVLFSNTRLFSPTLARSSVRLLPRLTKRERVISYTLDIEPTSGGVPVRRFSGFSLPPSSLVWDGLDETNRICADGSYRATLSVKYENGQDAKAEPVTIVLDGTPPKAKLSLPSPLFSPNGDGNRDTIEIAQTIVSSGDTWLGEIINEKGISVVVREYTTDVPASFGWDGKTEHGDSVPDGQYRYRLSAVDEAGNEGRVESAPFKLDARKPLLVLSADKFAFSPNGDGFADSVRLSVVPSFVDGLASVSLRVLDETGSELLRFPDGALKSAYVWDGKKSDGKLAADGLYRVVVEARYEKGDLVRAENTPVLLDTTPPTLSADLSPLPFSPDADGENDKLNVRFAAVDKSALAGWSFAILDPEGYPFASFTGNVFPSDPIVWDGTDTDGNLVEAAQDYSYVYTVRDRLGNVARAEGKIPVDVFVLRDGDRLKIRVSSITFAPNAASFQVVDPVLSEKNRTVLDRIATVLGKFPNYRIRIEGHAVNLTGTEREERAELEPLSLARAKTVVDALVQRGIARERLESRGLGGREPIVPHGDEQARWRNRRVEFILVR